MLFQCISMKRLFTIYTHIWIVTNEDVLQHSVLSVECYLGGEITDQRNPNTNTEIKLHMNHHQWRLDACWVGTRSVDDALPESIFIRFSFIVATAPLLWVPRFVYLNLKNYIISTAAVRHKPSKFNKSIKISHFGNSRLNFEIISFQEYFKEYIRFLRFSEG